MKALLLAALLCASVAPLGTLTRTIQTDLGLMRIYSDPLGCSLTLGGEVVDRVERSTCES